MRKTLLAQAIQLAIHTRQYEAMESQLENL